MVGVFMFFVLISCPKLVIVISRIIIMFLFAIAKRCLRGYPVSYKYCTYKWILILEIKL